MNRYIGIAKEKGDAWYMINIMLFNRMLKLTLYTLKYKKPKYYYYNKSSFIHCMDLEIINLKWFFGVTLKL